MGWRVKDKGAGFSPNLNRGRNAYKIAMSRGGGCRVATVQGYLAHKKHPPPRTLQWGCAQGPMVALGRGGGPCERGTPVALCLGHAVKFQGFDTEECRGVRDQICTTQGPKLSCVSQVDF